MLIEEIRMAGQIVRNVLDLHGPLFKDRTSPSKTLVAGPVIQTDPPLHSIVSVPPRAATLTGESSRPHRMPATAAAHAPVPQASVSPAPRSQTRSRMRVTIDDLHVARVHALRKARMMLDERTFLAPGRGPRRRRTAPHAGCPSTAPRSTGLPSIVQRPEQFVVLVPRLQAAKRRRARARLEYRRPHVDRHFARRCQPRFDDAGQRFDADRVLVRQPLVAHEVHEAARAVAALFDLAAVAVEDAVAKVDVACARRLDDQDLVGTDAEAPIRQLAAAASRESSIRCVTPSSITKSLPAPCILVKRSFIRRECTYAGGV